ncbi:MAG: hypothetical protein N838_14630 [Thiohalocapsa sp. PB-PSB1]|jgi:hypothetical protein|nr:MAG: hypothetical protein N838_14630 [Thiohalocapsa sp. PB-PSB1]
MDHELVDPLAYSRTFLALLLRLEDHASGAVRASDYAISQQFQI